MLILYNHNFCESFVILLQFRYPFGRPIERKFRLNLESLFIKGGRHLIDVAWKTTMDLVVGDNDNMDLVVGDDDNRDFGVAKVVELLVKECLWQYSLKPKIKIFK